MSDRKPHSEVLHAELAYVDYDWALDVVTCPCDVQFVEWLDDQSIRDSTIFHFGTGAHHYVGSECAKPARRNSVLGITAAPGEYSRFMEMAKSQPELLRHYSVLFGDIYLLNERLLPTFDVATLFHVCEFRNWRHESYEAMSDIEVTRLVTAKVRPGGHMLFYEGSLAFEWPETGTRALIAQWQSETGVEPIGRYKSLLIYRKPL